MIEAFLEAPLVASAVRRLVDPLAVTLAVLVLALVAVAARPLVDPLAVMLVVLVLALVAVAFPFAFPFACGPLARVRARSSPSGAARFAAEFRANGPVVFPLPGKLPCVFPTCPVKVARK